MFSQVWMTVLASLLLLRCSGVVAQNENYFINPPSAGNFGDMSSNPNYKTGDKVQVQWDMTYEAADIYIWQAAVYGSYKILYRSTDISGFTWTVPGSADWNLNGYNKSLATSYSTFYFYVYDSSNDKNGFTCHYFNISDPSATSTAASSTATATASATMGNNPSAKPTTSSADTDDSSNSSSGLTSAQKVGLGVGLGIGLPAVAALVGALAWWFRKRKGRYQPVSVTNVDGAAGGPWGSNTAYGGAAGYYKPPAPLGASPNLQDAGSKVIYGGTHEMSAIPDASGSRLAVSELDSHQLPQPPVEMPTNEPR